MSFFECEFPRTIQYKSVGGTGWNTSVNQGLSGQESRNANWAARRAKWQVSLITPATFRGNQQQFIDLLESFFDAVKGRSDAFRLYDHVRFQATNQPLISYNSNTQLAITRTIGGRSIVRVITKPITAAVSDYQGNALPNTVVLHGTNTAVTVDPTTGIVSGHGPGTAVDFQYHWPVRFDVDALQMQIEESPKGQPIAIINTVELLEVRPPNY
jgi:uncharacterized protein (TIGR02217 family)